ncbi:MAG TPA: hypothetical protein VGN44_03590 [Candidatus Angelobacter sp.]|jgi:hypothetical protein
MPPRLLAATLVVMLLGLSMQAQSGSNARNCFIGAKDLLDDSAPQFQAYLAKPSAPIHPARLDLSSNQIAKRYRTVIRREMSSGANFAGSYRVVIWGCGSSCAQFAVVNLKTGRVITATDVTSVSGIHLLADDFLPKTNSDSWGFRFRKNSRLLVLIGALNEDDAKAGAFYFVLNDEKLSLVHKTIAARNTCDAD